MRNKENVLFYQNVYFIIALDVVSLGMFCNWDVIYLGHFVVGSFEAWNILYLGRFVAGTLCLGTFYIWNVLMLGCFVLGNIVQYVYHRMFFLTVVV
jgi:hypothetical protein